MCRTGPVTGVNTSHFRCGSTSPFAICSRRGRAENLVPCEGLARRGSCCERGRGVR